MQGEMSN